MRMLIKMGLRAKFNAVVTVEPMIMLYFLGESLLSTGLQALVYNKYCLRDYGNLTMCSDAVWQQNHPDVQSQTSIQSIYSSLVNMAPAMAMATLLGGYSQSHGLMLPTRLPLVFGILNTGWIALQAWYMYIGPEFALIGSFVSGLGGSFSAVLMASISYVIRDSSEDNRPMRIAVVEFCTGAAVTAGTFAAGIIIDRLGLFWLFVIAGACELLALIDTLFRLRPNATEQLEYRMIAATSLKNNCTALLSPKSVQTYWRILTRPRENGKRLHLHLAVLAFMLSFTSGTGTTTVRYLYFVKENGFTNTEYSIYQGVAYTLEVSGMLLFMYVYTKWLKLHTLTIAVLGVANSALCTIVLMVANTRWLFWVTAAFRFQSGMDSAALRTFISNCGEFDEQGAIMSYVATVQNVCTVFASVMFNGVYAETVQFWPGTAFALATFLWILAVPLLTFIERHENGQGPSQSGYEPISNSQAIPQIAGVNT